MTQTSRTTARQYARALLKLAEARGEDEPLRLRGELRQLADLVEQHPGLRSAVGHPGIDSESRRRVLVAIAESGGASPLLVRLVGLLAARDHLSLLALLAEVYGALMNAARGIVPAEVTGAIALTGEQQRALAASLRAAVGREVELTTQIEASVLGGLRVDTGGKTYDGTVRAQLAALRRSLATGS